jgi:acyl-CoA thioesterase
VATAFEAHTAVQPRADGSLEGRIDPSWNVVRGPNGGYVAAIVLRAMLAAVDDPARTPRSLTVHYLAAPAPGPVTVHPRLERVGRSLATVSARMDQDGRTVGLALAAFSPPWPGVEFQDESMPSVPPPDELEPFPEVPAAPDFLQHWDQRWALGPPPFSGADSAQTGGWIRPAEPQELDAPLVAAIMDAWPPALFSRLTEPVVAPTLDLTIHFRRALPPPGAQEGEHCLLVARSRAAAEGFWEEDVDLWDRRGVLLAQSRQLALATPL